jgi:hypothetical protein
VRVKDGAEVGIGLGGGRHKQLLARRVGCSRSRAFQDLGEHETIIIPEFDSEHIRQGGSMWYPETRETRGTHSFRGDGRDKLDLQQQSACL